MFNDSQKSLSKKEKKREREREAFAFNLAFTMVQGLSPRNVKNNVP